MSYILEALKKAQAERQLGNAPTLHAPQVQPAQPGAAASRKPLMIGLGAGVLVVALGALLVWQRTPAPVPASTPPAGAGAMPAAAVAGPAAVPAAPAAAAQGPALATPAGAGRTAAGGASNTLEVSAPPAPEPVPAPARPAHAAPPAAGRAGGDAIASTAPVRAPARAPAVPASAAAPTPAPALAPAPEDSLPYLRQLPDTIQRDIPRVTFGGYMYSANPADRLLLVDKTLRHEGEEVGPGLVLEKLLPKAAVMNFRGIRYRVAY
jgi:general secretion pathway protein B